MPPDKFTATWVSHSSISDFLNCPRAYYLKNVYKDPKTNHKIQIMTPPLALGSAVHEVIESLSTIPTVDRFKEPLAPKFKNVWLEKASGKKGGFFDKESEEKYYNQGIEMIKRVLDHPGPLANLAVKITMELPYFWLSEPDNIILCGKIDWLEYLKKTDSVHIIDFKTGKSSEDPKSLQLPIYHLLVHNTQKRKVEKASYWYLQRKNKPEEQKLPDLDKAHKKVLEIAKRIKLARQLDRFKCPHNGCFKCKDFETILEGGAELVNVSDFGSDVYVIKKPSSSNTQESIIL
ncbi:PD-(D/E)XK nuclease family protein [Patescibacteria group bacterium]|nr:PD-(D/E)XK nuclease family protein [Patescibacteria group bacterium]